MNTITQPPPIAAAHIRNYNTLMRAVAKRDVALVSAFRRSDGKAVALICAMQTNADKSVTPVPFAVMVEGDPFKDFSDPTRV